MFFSWSFWVESLQHTARDIMQMRISSISDYFQRHSTQIHACDWATTLENTISLKRTLDDDESEKLKISEKLSSWWKTTQSKTRVYYAEKLNIFSIKSTSSSRHQLIFQFAQSLAGIDGNINKFSLANCEKSRFKSVAEYLLSLLATRDIDGKFLCKCWAIKKCLFSTLH